MTHKIFHSDLPLIDYDFPSHYNQKITNSINSLKFEDLKEVVKYNRLLEEMKSNFSLNQVNFGKPEIVNHRVEEVNMQANYEYPRAIKVKVFKINVEIQFTGSLELFNYRPNGYTHSSNGLEIYQPLNNKISLEITSTSLSDKENIFKEIAKDMELTYQFIDSNNKFIQEWNKNVNEIIDTKLNDYRNILLNLYN